METKKTIINVPKGCKATVEQNDGTVVITISSTLPTKYEDIGEVKGFDYYSTLGRTEVCYVHPYKDTTSRCYSTPEEANASRMIGQLSVLRDKYNGCKLEELQADIYYSVLNFKVSGLKVAPTMSKKFLSFASLDTAELFLETFEPLIQEILCVQL